MNDNEIFKVTALLYFKDALIKQEYESCKGLISSAKKFGAEQGEIDETIALVLRGGKANGQNEANRIKGQLYSLKEGK